MRGLSAVAVMSKSSSAFKKTLVSDRSSAQRPVLAAVNDEISQVDYVVNKVLDAREAGVPLKRQAVLFRTNHHSDALEVELTNRNIPYVKFGGLKFLESAHIKDLLCVLRWAENPTDQVAAFRVLQLLSGIGPSHARRLLEAHHAQNCDFRRFHELVPPKGAADEKACEPFAIPG